MAKSPFLAGELDGIRRPIIALRMAFPEGEDALLTYNRIYDRPPVGGQRMEIKAGWEVPSNEAERARRIALNAGVLDDGFHPIHQQGKVVWPLNEMVNVLFGEIIQSNF